MTAVMEEILEGLMALTDGKTFSESEVITATYQAAMIFRLRAPAGRSGVTPRAVIKTLRAAADLAEQQMNAFNSLSEAERAAILRKQVQAVYGLSDDEAAALGEKLQ
jgi:hypothetical protein